MSDVEVVPLIESVIEVQKDDQNNHPSAHSITAMITQLTTFGVPEEDILFSGHPGPLAGAAVDTIKISGDTYDLLDEKGDDFLSLQDILATQFKAQLDEEFPDPDTQIRQLAQQGLDYQDAGDDIKVAQIRTQVSAIRANRDRMLSERQRRQDDLEELLGQSGDRPVYYANPVSGLIVPSVEDNPLAYATGQHDFWLEDGDEAFLSCYSRRRLETAGASVVNLADITHRTDEQVAIIVKSYKTMLAGQFALVRCTFTDQTEEGLYGG